MSKRPPAPPNGCQKYHGVPGCRCQVRASKDQPHPGAHHCNEHDRYWTDREEMYVEMYLSVAAKWVALLEHADLAEDVQPEEVIDALSVRCSRRAGDLQPAAPAEERPFGVRRERLAAAIRSVVEDGPARGRLTLGPRYTYRDLAEDALRAALEANHE